MPSFDILCEANAVEVKNAVDTANKEIANRFDFKGSDARIEWKEKEHELTAYADDDFKLAMTQEELAGLVGASRERVNKALALFVRLGWVEARGRGRYKLLDRAALEQRANP